MDKILGMFGLARKAGKTVSGEFSVETAVRDHKAFYVLIAGDASANTKKKFENACTYHKVPYMIYSDKASIGHALGQEERATAALTDQGFAEAVKKLENKRTIEE